MTKNPNIIKHPMNPVYDRKARVLILGSMPGGASLAACQYYAYPKNQFWDIMDELVGAGRRLEYEERLAALRRGKIALWDVIASCERKGSLDTAIRPDSVVVNRVRDLFAKCPELRTVCFNGKAAERYYKQYVSSDSVPEIGNMRMLLLPSTSPAHAAMTFSEKIDRWRKILPELEK